MHGLCAQNPCKLHTCTIYGDTYPFTLSGNTMGYCLNTGRIAADTIADILG